MHPRLGMLACDTPAPPMSACLSRPSVCRHYQMLSRSSLLAVLACLALAHAYRFEGDGTGQLNCQPVPAGPAGSGRQPGCILPAAVLQPEALPDRAPALVCALVADGRDGTLFCLRHHICTY